MEQSGRSRIKRLQMEERQIIAKKKQFPEIFLYLGPVATKTGKNIEIWQFKFKGKKDTAFEGGFYDVQMEFPPQYPSNPPKLKFLHDFKHMHVYLSGDICLPIIDNLRWTMNITIYDIACAISNMIHGTPNPNDRASDQMKELYIQGGEMKYWQFIKEQAQQFSKYEKFMIEK